MAPALLSLCVCVLGVGLVSGQLGCVWEWKRGQGLDPASLERGADSAHLPELTEPESCRQACCSREDCQLALLRTAADDGLPQCFLVNCIKDGEDVCVFTPNSQSEAFLRTSDSESSTEYCRLQAIQGRCRASMPRFFYDVTNQTCKKFIYGGCGGNRNNFDTPEECETACSGVKGDTLIDSRDAVKSRIAIDSEGITPLPKMTSDEFAEKCLAEKKVGNCRAAIPRYYYQDGTCQRFLYGGCGANQNNYASEMECMKTCTVEIVPSKKSKSDDDYEEACTVSSDTGPCRGAFKMFYFEPTTQSCQEFVYGGCKGNKNRYVDPEECMAKCTKQDGSFIGHFKKHDRWTPAFFLVGTLSIMSLLLLVGLLMISVRRVRHQGHHLILDDKQVLLPEWNPADEEQYKTEST